MGRRIEASLDLATGSRIPLGIPMGKKSSSVEYWTQTVVKTDQNTNVPPAPPIQRNHIIEFFSKSYLLAQVNRLNVSYLEY